MRESDCKFRTEHSQSGQMVIYPNSIVFGGRCSPMTGKLQSSSTDATARSRENAQQENCGRLAVLSLEI